MKRLIGIACTDQIGTIATDEGLPWQSKDELQYLTNRISDRRVLMTRRVFQEMGSKAPYRHATIVTRTPNYVSNTGRTRFVNAITSTVTELDLPSENPLFVLGGSFLWDKLEDHLTDWDIGIWLNDIYPGTRYHPFMDRVPAGTTMYDAVVDFVNASTEWDFVSITYHTYDLGELARVRLTRAS